jgi:hypothetical protein
MNYPPAQNHYGLCLSQSLNPVTALYGYFATINLGTWSSENGKGFETFGSSLRRDIKPH